MYLFVGLCVCLSVYQICYLSVFVCLSVCLFVYLSAFLFILKKGTECNENYVLLQFRIP